MNSKSIIHTITLVVLFLTASHQIFSREFQGQNLQRTAQPAKVLAICRPAQSSAELAVNNVRTIIYSGSDMWWDLFGGSKAFYYVPKVDDRSKGASSNFAGNIWFGGIDQSGNLKVAAQTYRQFGGIDFWTGPLSTIDATTTSDECQKYDKIFKITREEVNAFVAGGQSAITNAIKDWPGNGDLTMNQDVLLAPFKDLNSNNYYEPEKGEYPDYDVNDNLGKDDLGVCKARLFGDETLWWVYNDVGAGNVHGATKGPSIGLEIRAQAFAFKTTNEVNDMTFYNYQIFNRSTSDLTKTYMTVWTDADMGYPNDDYIGCDVKRGLGYIYNSDNFDESANGFIGYGSSIPALGCDFFQGPINTTNNIDDDNDGVSDEKGEQMGMTKFLYFNNLGGSVPSQQTDPTIASQYYNYMTGFWKDGTPFTCDAARGYGGSKPTSFMFPGDTYSNNPCGASSPSASDNGLGGDRRFLQSSGPFDLKSGAVNYVTVGLPWARTTTDVPYKSVELLKVADDKAQALFDNCFKVISGPEAPDMTIQELDNELIIYFTNKPTSNNYLFNYQEKDPLSDAAASATDGAGNKLFGPKADGIYRFEGFKVYQLKNNQVGQSDLNDQTKAKLVFNSDVVNGIARIINYENNKSIGADIASIKVDKNDNSDKGIKTSYRFTKDLFSSSPDQKVINQKEYYFLCVAYGYNQYGEYKADAPYTNSVTPSSQGQKLPYLEGRKSKKALGIPHNPVVEKGGTTMSAPYGSGPKITRLEGQGNGGNFLELTQETVDKILSDSKGNGRVDQITYEGGRGPVLINVVDPLNVPSSDFSIRFVSATWSDSAKTMNADPCRTLPKNKDKPYPPLTKGNPNHLYYGQVKRDSTTWILKDEISGKEYYPCKSLKIGEEYYFSELGLTVKIGGTNDVAGFSSVNDKVNNRIVKSDDIIGANISFENSSLTWLSGVPDVDGTLGFDWIKAGNFYDINKPLISDLQVSNLLTASTSSVYADENGYFEKILGGTWAPYALTSVYKNDLSVSRAGPGYDNKCLNQNLSVVLRSQFDLSSLASVDIVLTPDKSKWTRCLVLEENEEPSSTVRRTVKLDPKSKKSVDKQGVALGAPGCVTSEAFLDSANGAPFQTGLSWFPGYAINLETGERLNIAFGEDSYQVDNNGDDMIWNPTDKVLGENRDYRYLFGGRHYIYVFGNNRSGTKYDGFAPKEILGKKLGVGNYSKFSDMVTVYKTATNFLNKIDPNGDNTVIENRIKSANTILVDFWSEAMWVNMPITVDKQFNFKDPSKMPCAAKVSLRVKKAYRHGLAGHCYVKPGTGSTSAGYTTPTGAASNYIALPPTNLPAYSAVDNLANTSSITTTTSDTSLTPKNNNFGYYTFNTRDLVTSTSNAGALKSSLELINVVPNPYYGSSTYEVNRIDNKVRITNLPNKCKIKIFTLNGTLIRTFDRDVSDQEDVFITDVGEYKKSKRISYQDWDIKNQSGIPVASGLYIIHIDVPGVGEKILKWFGVMRPLDLQSY